MVKILTSNTQHKMSFHDQLAELSEINTKIQELEKLRYECRVVMHSHPPVSEYTKLSTPVANRLAKIIEALGSEFARYKALKHVRENAIDRFQKVHSNITVRKNDASVFRERMGLEVTMLITLDYLNKVIARERMNRSELERACEVAKLCDFKDLM